MKRNKMCALMIACALSIGGATAQTAASNDTTTQTTPPEKFAPAKKKLDDFSKELTSRIKLHGYAQGGYTYTHRGGTDANTFDIKRVLFWADARITDRWSFLFMHDFSSVVQEYYTDFRITKDKWLTVRFGQFKNGLSYENKLSPTSMEAIDVYSEGATYLSGCGSDPLYGVQYGRDLGLALFGELPNGMLAYEFEVMNGQGINRKDGNNDKDFIGRLEFRPVKGLNIIATGQIGRGHAVNTSLYNPAIAVGDNYKRDRWTAGFDYKSKVFNAHGEYLEGRDGGVTSRGGYVTFNVPLGNTNCDLVGSYDYFNFNTDLGMDQHKAIGGIQYWFYKKCRVQLQYVYKSAYTDNGQFIHGDSHAVMCQMQIRFN
ncbi:MAG: OprO/OprP family phosphate-selective porin [Paludibacteraceae bacterium]|nr:OprO/OprP family phosphate-selective porin [Paludibacteraceae bacterium]